MITHCIPFHLPTQCSFVEAYPGGQLGYVQVTKVSGDGPTLLLLPALGTSFEVSKSDGVCGGGSVASE